LKGHQPIANAFLGVIATVASPSSFSRLAAVEGGAIDLVLYI